MSEFDRIIGYEYIKADIARFASVLKEPERYTGLGVTIPSGIFLYGEPGVGKTLIAECFIAETKRKAFVLRKERPNEEFINCIRSTYEMAREEAAKKGIAIVFLDDLDKFANDDEDHRNAEEYVTVQSCIDDCKGQGVFTIATANSIVYLPLSLIRPGRFDKTIKIKTPEGKESEKIIRHFLSKKSTVGDIDIKEVSMILEGSTCAELEMVINEAGINAGFDGRNMICQSDIIDAYTRLLFDAPEALITPDETNLRKCAVHEAGHAVVSEVFSPGIVKLISITDHTGSIEGFVKKTNPFGIDLSKELQEQSVVARLGGRAATEVVYGVPDMGCMSDISDAFDIVSAFVDTECTLGFRTHTSETSSPYLQAEKERVIASEIERYYHLSKRIITENRVFLDELVQALLEHKTVTRSEIERIREKVGAKTITI